MQPDCSHRYYKSQNVNWDFLLLFISFLQGETREHFRHDPCKYVTVAGWHILVDEKEWTKEFSFQLTDPIRRNVYQFRTESSEETNLWLHHLNTAVNVNNINKRSSKNLMSFDWTQTLFLPMSTSFNRFNKVPYKE